MLDRENFLYFKLLQSGTGFSDSGRIVSTVGHPVTLGFFLVPGILLMIHRFINRMNILHFVIISILVTGLFLTFTRGSWIAVGIPLLLLLFKHKAVILKFGTVAVLLLGALIFFSGEVRNTLLTRNPMSYIQNPVEKNRISSYLTVSKILTEFPLFGVGTANFRIQRFEYDEFQTVIEGPDNLYLMILAENGILGFAAFVILLYTIFNRINKRLKETKSEVIREHLEIYKLIFIAFLINFFFFDALYHPVPRMIFWSFLGVMASLAYRTDEELTQNA
ncbi:O-antigen ligase family protein [Patescibacteria group bacterium]|nr:O-antigen ligase family protein [Patescibacteria group bacterium]